MLAHPQSLAGHMLRVHRPQLPSSFFYHCVNQAIAMMQEAVPESLTACDISVEDVPDTSGMYSDHIPLAVSTSPHNDHTHIILFRRPMERQASDRSELRQLIVASLVEQVSASTGYSVDTLDPKNLRGE